ncbi:hypothetical protein RND81_08G193600 [Saponaria officinalis]|uniref:Uncharacterized protein n=1 Tax=Saponaria officinalis TaxID=3572 RepID=A0AAW1JA40_SAPOF
MQVHWSLSGILSLHPPFSFPFFNSYIRKQGGMEKGFFCSLSSDRITDLDCSSILFAQRAVPIRVITVGKKRSSGVQLIVDEYKEKLQHYCNIDDVLIRSNPRNARDAKAQTDDEDSAVLGLIKTNDCVVILDERGQDVSSERLTEFIGDAGFTGAASLLFCIGGPYGHGDNCGNALISRLSCHL